MTTTRLRGIECPDRVLIPANQSNLLMAAKAITTKRQYEEIQKIVLSLQHKLNIAMYQAALICELKPEDFKSFEERVDAIKKVEQFSKIDYKIFSYTVSDIDEYRLILSFLIETLAATVFSLFDISGSLLNQLYLLEIKEKKVSFYNAMEQIETKERIDANDIIYKLLCSYAFDEPNRTSKALREITWVKPMKEIRNRTTHRPITEVCDIHEISGIYAKIYQGLPKYEFFINNDILLPNTSLCNFAKEVFNGVEEFVEDFFFFLTEATQRSENLPLWTTPI